MSILRSTEDVEYVVIDVLIIVGLLLLPTSPSKYTLLEIFCYMFPKLLCLSCIQYYIVKFITPELRFAVGIRVEAAIVSVSISSTLAGHPRFRRFVHYLRFIKGGFTTCAGDD